MASSDDEGGIPVDRHDSRFLSMRTRSTESAFDRASRASYEWVQNLPFFAKRDASFVKQLCEYIEIEMFQAGQDIIVEGEKGDKMYLLYRGTADVLIKSGTMKVATLEGGSVFGEMALFGTPKRTATVRANEFCNARSISHGIFHMLLRKFPKEQEYFAELTRERKAQNTSKEEKECGNWRAPPKLAALSKAITILTPRHRRNSNASQKSDRGSRRVSTATIGSLDDVVLDKESGEMPDEATDREQLPMFGRTRSTCSTATETDGSRRASDSFIGEPEMERTFSGIPAPSSTDMDSRLSTDTDISAPRKRMHGRKRRDKFLTTPADFRSQRQDPEGEFVEEVCKPELPALCDPPAAEMFCQTPLDKSASNTWNPGPTAADDAEALQDWSEAVPASLPTSPRNSLTSRPRVRRHTSLHTESGGSRRPELPADAMRQTVSSHGRVFRKTKNAPEFDEMPFRRPLSVGRQPSDRNDRRALTSRFEPESARRRKVAILRAVDPSPLYDSEPDPGSPASTSASSGQPCSPTSPAVHGILQGPQKTFGARMLQQCIATYGRSMTPQSNQTG